MRYIYVGKYIATTKKGHYMPGLTQFKGYLEQSYMNVERSCTIRSDGQV